MQQVQTPIAGICGAAWELSDESSPPEVRRELSSLIKVESDRINHVLSELLQYSEMEAPAMEDVDVRGLVEEVCRTVQSYATEARVFIRSDLAWDIGSLRCDAGQLKRALRTLVLGSVRAMPGGSDLTVRARREGDEVQVQVVAKGEGVVGEGYFDPLSPTREGSNELGLAIADMIVSRHGGWITAESNPDVGMTVSVILPICRRPNERGANPGGGG